MGAGAGPVEGRGSRCRKALVWFVFEHKSKPDRFLAYDLLRSAVRVLESWRRRHPKRRELPRVVPVVLYAGDRTFRAPRRLSELCSDDVPHAGALGPDLTYVLTDVSRIDDDALRARTGAVALAALAYLLLKHARADDFFERLARWTELVRALLRAPTAADAFRSLLSYVCAVRGPDAGERLAEVVLPRLDEHERETFMTTFKSYADHLREEGMAKGLEAGREAGREEGRRRDAAEKLLRLLRHRFDVSAALRTRVGAASIEELDRWFDRALDAGTLDDVFGEG